MCTEDQKPFYCSNMRTKGIGELFYSFIIPGLGFLSSCMYFIKLFDVVENLHSAQLGSFCAVLRSSARAAEVRRRYLPETVARRVAAGGAVRGSRDE